MDIGDSRSVSDLRDVSMTTTTGESAGPAPMPVGIGLIARAGRFLVRRRPSLPGSPMPGFWEFPGGKCEPGESPEAAVIRECLEEVGVPILAHRLRKVVEHRYPHGFVALHFFDCETRMPDDEPPTVGGFVWVGALELPALAFPGGNAAIVEELAAEAEGPASRRFGTEDG